MEDPVAEKEQPIIWLTRKNRTGAKYTYYQQRNETANKIPWEYIGLYTY